MPSIANVVKKQAQKLQIDLQKPLSRQDVSKLKGALEDVGVTATAAEIREAAAGAVADLGDRTRSTRRANSGAGRNAGSDARTASSVSVRAGAAPIFDAAAALKKAIGTENAAGGMQWSQAETSGLSIGGPVVRWVPSEAELAKMDKKPLADVIGSASADVMVYWPKTAAGRAPGTEIFLERKNVFGQAEFTSLSLRAPQAAAPAPSPSTAGTSAKDMVKAAIAKSGVTDANMLARGSSEIELYLLNGSSFQPMREALLAQGFVETTVDDPYTRSPTRAYKDPASGVFVRLVKDEEGGV